MEKEEGGSDETLLCVFPLGKTPKEVPSDDKSSIEANFAHFPQDCKVYLLYFSGPRKFPELERSLLDWGLETEKNLVIGYIGQGDDGYQSLVKVFSVEQLPAIVMTGSDSIASIQKGEHKQTVFVKLDDKGIMSRTQITMDALAGSYNLFLRGDFGNALSSLKKFEGHIKIQEFFKGLGETAAKIGKFLDEHNIQIGLATGTFNITRPQK